MTILSLISTLNRFNGPRSVSTVVKPLLQLSGDYIQYCTDNRLPYQSTLPPFLASSCHSPVTSDSLESLFVPFVSLWFNHHLGGQTRTGLCHTVRIHNARGFHQGSSDAVLLSLLPNVLN